MTPYARERFNNPIAQAVDTKEFTKIIAAVAGDDALDREIVGIAGRLAGLFQGEITFVSVVQPDVGPAVHSAGSPLGGVVIPPSEFSHDLQERIDERKARLREVIAREIGEALNYHYEVRDGQVGDEVLRAAEEHSANLIVVGAHDRSWIEGLFSKETAKRVASLAKCPVLIIPEPAKSETAFVE